MDRLSRNEFPAFITIFLHNVGTPSEVTDALQRLKPSNELAHVVSNTDYFLQNYSSNPSAEDLIRFNMKVQPEVLRNIDTVTKAYGKNSKLLQRIVYMRNEGIPTNLKELSVKGEDLMALGLNGPQIGKTLNDLLSFAIKNKTNDKNKLLSSVS